jgi:hypothetical protein
MITAQSQAGIGSPRPHLRGLSATVTGLQQPADSKWAEAYRINRFGSTSSNASYRSYFLWFFGGAGSVVAGGGFRAFLAKIRSGIIGGGVS